MAIGITFYSVKEKPVPMLKQDAEIFAKVGDNFVVLRGDADNLLYHEGERVKPSQIQYWACLPGQSIADIADIEPEKPLTAKQLKALQVKKEKETKALEMVDGVLKYVNYIIEFKEECRTEVKRRGKELDLFIKQIKKQSNDVSKYLEEFINSERFEDLWNFEYNGDYDDYDYAPTYTAKKPVKLEHFTKYYEQRCKGDDEGDDEYDN